jgi:hypothetical protein
VRLGDDIDDYCSRCKRSTDHAVVSMMGDEVLKTRCRTCSSEHAYRHNKGGRKEMTAKEAYEKLISSMPGGQSSAEDTPSKKKRKKE